MTEPREEEIEVGVPELPDRFVQIESALKQNYQLFAIVGVFGALAIYLFSLRDASSTQLVDWGVAGTLLMFLLSTMTLVYKLSHEMVHTGGIGLVYRAYVGVFIVGLAAVALGVFGIVSQFLGEIATLISFVIAGTIYTVYLSLFPWSKFTGFEGLSSKKIEKVENAPHIGNTWAVLAVILSGIWIPDLPRIDGHDPLLLIPLVILAIVVHTSVSFGLRWYHLRSYPSTW